MLVPEVDSNKCANESDGMLYTKIVTNIMYEYNHAFVN